jgi:hypothetical protein
MNPRLIEIIVMNQKKASQPRLACWPEILRDLERPAHFLHRALPVMTWPSVTTII